MNLLFCKVEKKPGDCLLTYDMYNLVDQQKGL